ncbi:MAG: ABC transporter ATP-binding protein [Acholeplasmatales bacterium]|nr:ABC transporter ATP-binding protein [Acholeplasmatales bacterium]
MVELKYISNITNDDFVIRYDASGKNNDDWANNNVRYQLGFSKEERKTSNIWYTVNNDYDNIINWYPMDKKNNMIKLENVSKTFKDNDQLEVLKNISFEIEDNTFTTIVGKSGSGKTTLMNIIGSIDVPTSGDVYVCDKHLNNLNDKEISEYRNKTVGFVFQSFYLEQQFSVLENVCMPLVIAGVKRKEREETARKYLALLDMLDKEKTKVYKLSGGEKQRVAIARALVNDAKVILADEPTGNLDTKNGTIVLDELKKLTKIGKTVVLITHNMEDAKKYSDRILLLKDGVISYENN